MNICGARLFRDRTLLALVALGLMWGVGLFGRNYWTPDEPREAALSLSVSTHWSPLPALAGVTFAEKPPLTYWLAGAAMQRLGATPAAARLPQLFYALLSFIAVTLLAGRLIGNAPASRASALATGLLFATSELVYQVQVWLDTDALLLAGVCLALSGMYAALSSDAATARLRSYLIMHAGVTLAFFGKNFAAWLVPVLAFLCVIVWERRWRELWRWEFYLPALLPLTCIVLWVLAVAAQADGAQSLRILFWNNLVGRAMPVAAAAQFNYSSGHQNVFGRYLVELPLDLLPWTVLALCALKAAWCGARAAGPRRAAWRFALCAALPGLLVLSLASTARSIYAVPCMIGFVLLIGLWVTEPADAGRGRGRGRGRGALRVTAVLLALLALLVLAITVVLQGTVERASLPVFIFSAGAAMLVGLWCTRQALVVAQSMPTALMKLATAWSVLLSVGVLSLFGAMNRTQNIESLAARVSHASGPGPLLFWSPDETTLAWAQLYLPAGSWRAVDAAELNAAETLTQSLRKTPTITVVSMISGSGWPREAWLDYLHGRATVAELSTNGAADEPTLNAVGLQPTAHVARPGGRGYVIWRRSDSLSGIHSP